MLSFRNTLIAASLAALARAQSTTTTCDATDPATPPEVCSIRAAFGGNNIPDVVPTFLPLGALYVHTDGIQIGGAQQLAPSRVSSPPGIQYNLTQGLEAGPTYVFAMFDPDAGANADVLHYLLTDCTVNEETLYLQGCTAAAPYGGPAPPEGTGPHRYIQLLFTQPEGFETPDYPATIQGTRLGWNHREFFAGNNLGNPVGGMYFQSSFAGDVPQASSTQDPNTVGGAAVASTSSAASSSAASSSSAPTSSASSRNNAVSSSARSVSSAPASASVVPANGAEKTVISTFALFAGVAMAALL